MTNILVLHGPNLNLLGMREPELYGRNTLEHINHDLMNLSQSLGVNLTCLQSNAEAELIEIIQQAKTNHYDFLIINPAAFTHTSIAIRDAIFAIGLPFIEVHITNIYAREPFRHHSYFSDLAIAVITGFGAKGYEYALRGAHDFLIQQRH